MVHIFSPLEDATIIFLVSLYVVPWQFFVIFETDGITVIDAPQTFISRQVAEPVKIGLQAPAGASAEALQLVRQYYVKTESLAIASIFSTVTPVKAHAETEPIVTNFVYTSEHTGSVSLHGENGEDGKDGKDGEDGKGGAVGADGKDGGDGEAGRDGQDGIDGASSINIETSNAEVRSSLSRAGESAAPAESAVTTSSEAVTVLNDGEAQPSDQNVPTNSVTPNVQWTAAKTLVSFLVTLITYVNFLF